MQKMLILSVAMIATNLNAASYKPDSFLNRSFSEKVSPLDLSILIKPGSSPVERTPTPYCDQSFFRDVKSPDLLSLRKSPGTPNHLKLYRVRDAEETIEYLKRNKKSETPYFNICPITGEYFNIKTGETMEFESEELNALFEELTKKQLIEENKIYKQYEKLYKKLMAEAQKLHKTADACAIYVKLLQELSK